MPMLLVPIIFKANGEQIRKHLVERFKPTWFISVMGTGISSTLLYNFPYEAEWLKICGLIMFGVCSFLLLTSTILFGLSLIYKSNRKGIFENLSINIFLGCYAMGFMSWLNMVHYLTHGSSPLTIYALWWVGCILSIFTSWFIFFKILSKSTFNLGRMTPTYLLPIVSLVVASSSGQIIGPSLPSANLQFSTIIISFFLLSHSMLIAFMIMVIYFHRLLSSKLPEKKSIFTTFILVGPFGQGSLSIQLFGNNIYNFIKENHIPFMEEDSQTQLVAVIALKYIGLMCGLFLQAMGFFLTFLSIASVLSYGSHEFHYGMWAMTFPLGTMAIGTRETYILTGWRFFRVISAIYATTLFIATLSCIIGSLWLMIRSLLSEHENEVRNDKPLAPRFSADSDSTVV